MITHIIFYDSDYNLILNRNKKTPEVAHEKAKEFCIKLTVEEAGKLANLIADLYCLVEKDPGRDKNYESIVESLEMLLAEGKTATEGTVAEQFASQKGESS